MNVIEDMRYPARTLQKYYLAYSAYRPSLPKSPSVELALEAVAKISTPTQRPFRERVEEFWARFRKHEPTLSQFLNNIASGQQPATRKSSSWTPRIFLNSADPHIQEGRFNHLAHSVDAETGMDIPHYLEWALQEVGCSGKYELGIENGRKRFVIRGIVNSYHRVWALQQLIDSLPKDLAQEWDVTAGGPRLWSQQGDYLAWPIIYVDPKEIEVAFVEDGENVRVLFYYEPAERYEDLVADCVDLIMMILGEPLFLTHISQIDQYHIPLYEERHHSMPLTEARAYLQQNFPKFGFHENLKDWLYSLLQVNVNAIGEKEFRSSCLWPMLSNYYQNLESQPRTASTALFDSLTDFGAVPVELRLRRRPDEETDLADPVNMRKLLKKINSWNRGSVAQVIIQTITKHHIDFVVFAWDYPALVKKLARMAELESYRVYHPDAEAVAPLL